MRSAEGVCGVVSAHERYACRLELVLPLLSVYADRRVVNAVERLYRPAFRLEVDSDTSA